MGAYDWGLTKKSNYVKIILSTELVKGVKVGKMDFLVSPGACNPRDVTRKVFP
jgi:hypothetical protein